MAAELKKNMCSRWFWAPQVEMISLYPGNKVHEEILGKIRGAFDISEKEYGYEVHLRAALSEIWLKMFEQSGELLLMPSKPRKNNDKIKDLMIYIHQHYGEKISVSEVAASAYLSEA